MDETEWKLRRELLQTKMALYEAQSQLLKKLHDEAANELGNLGPAWVPPDAANNPI